MATPMAVCLAQLEGLLGGKMLTDACMMLLLRKGLGYMVILGSSMLKIYNVIANRSAKGLAPASLEATVLGFTIVLAYCLQKRLPFSTYGEAAFLLGQDVLLLALVYGFSAGSGLRARFMSALYALFLAALLRGWLVPVAVDALYSAHILIFIVARVPQIYRNFVARSTGQLSVISCGLLLFGNVVRIFTTLGEGSTAMLFGHLIGGSLNLIIVLQILLYWPKSKGDQAQKKSQ